MQVIIINQKVSEKFRVGYRDTFYKNQANIVSIINYFSEMARLAGKYYEQEKDILKEESIAWVILNWEIDVKRYPKYGEHIHVQTIAHAIDRFIAFREFLIYDENNKLITSAKSKWILFNVEKRRPTSARSYMYDLYGVTSTEAPFEINNPQAFDVDNSDFSKAFEIRKFDVDYYHHVNNAIYPLWIYESLPLNFTDTHIVKHIKLYYKKETTYGEHVIVHTRKTAENSYSHEIKNRKVKLYY